MLPNTESDASLLSARLGFWRWDVEVFADFAREKFVDFAVTRNCGDLTRHRIDVNGMIAAFPNEPTAVCFKVTEKIEPLHATIGNGSRITSAP